MISRIVRPSLIDWSRPLRSRKQQVVEISTEAADRVLSQVPPSRRRVQRPRGRVTAKHEPKNTEWDETDDWSEYTDDSVYFSLPAGACLPKYSVEEAVKHVLTPSEKPLGFTRLVSAVCSTSGYSYAAVEKAILRMAKLGDLKTESKLVQGHILCVEYHLPEKMDLWQAKQMHISQQTPHTQAQVLLEGQLMDLLGKGPLSLDAISSCITRPQRKLIPSALKMGVDQMKLRQYKGYYGATFYEVTAQETTNQEVTDQHIKESKQDEPPAKRVRKPGPGAGWKEALACNSLAGQYQVKFAK